VSAIAAVLVALLVFGLVLGAYALLAPRRKPEPVPTLLDMLEPLHTTTDWTKEAGDEFAGLSESARCDLIFAVSTLEDDRSQRLLEHALNDPAEAVALAAAHGLESSGKGDIVEAFLNEYPGERADRIAATLALLRPAADT